MPPISTLLATLVFFVLGHVVAFVVAKKVGVFRVLFFAFLFSSTFARATELPLIFVFKYLRIYMTAVFAAFGVWTLMKSIRRLGSLATTWIAAFSIFVIAGLWSEYPILAISFKGLSFCLVIAGVMIGAQQVSLSDIQYNIRSIYIAQVSLIAVIVIGLIASGGSSGRLSVFGLNPIGLGQVAATTIAVTVALRVSDPSTGRVVHWAVIGVSSLMVLLSGSRGAAGAAVICVLTVLSPNLKRAAGPVLLIGIIVGLVIVCLPEDVNELTVGRLGDLDIQDRSGFWREGLKGFYDSPLFGQGWAHQEIFGGTSWAQLHSIYVSVLTESGVVGGVLWAMFLVLLIAGGVRWFAMRSESPSVFRYQQAFCYSLVIWFLIVGVLESGPLTSSSPAPLLFSFAVGTLSGPLNPSEGRALQHG